MNNKESKRPFGSYFGTPAPGAKKGKYQADNKRKRDTVSPDLEETERVHKKTSVQSRLLKQKSSLEKAPSGGLYQVTTCPFVLFFFSPKISPEKKRRACYLAAMSLCERNPFLSTHHFLFERED